MSLGGRVHEIRGRLLNLSPSITYPLTHSFVSCHLPVHPATTAPDTLATQSRCQNGGAWSLLETNRAWVVVWRLMWGLGRHIALTTENSFLDLICICCSFLRIWQSLRLALIVSLLCSCSQAATVKEIAVAAEYRLGQVTILTINWLFPLAGPTLPLLVSCCPLSCLV